MTCFLNSYRSLARFKEGQTAIQNGMKPYIDYSCRKEPDFRSAYPSISGLCRPNFAPRLHEGDYVAYITVKGRYGDLPFSHWRLPAILEVVHRFETHQDAAAWYRAQGLPLPSNCMVSDNPPLSIEYAVPIPEFGTDIRRWDAAYHKRAREHSVFLACKARYLELVEPPIITHETMLSIFGRIPGTQNAVRITQAQFDALAKLAQEHVA